jgi:hypothetical protein
MIENGIFWISIDDWYVFLYSVCPKSIHICFFSYENPSAKAAFHQNIPIVIILIFLLQILCYSYSDLPGNVEVYFRFFQKNSTSIRGAEDDGWTSHVPDDVLFSGASR